MDPITAGGLITGGAQVLKTAGGIFTAKKDRQYNKQQAELAYKRNLEHWHRQNKYNDPSQQMARLKAAGLNPNMVYGTGSKAANTNTGEVKAPIPEGSFANPVPDLSGTMSNYFNMKVSQAQINNLDAQAYHTKVKAGLDIIKRQSEMSDWQRKQMENTLFEQYQAEFLKTRNEQAKQDLSLSKQRYQLGEIQKNVNQRNWEYFRDYNVRPNDPAWIKELVPFIQNGIKDGSLGEIQKELNFRIEQAKHLINIGIGTDFETRWNR